MRTRRLSALAGMLLPFVAVAQGVNTDEIQPQPAEMMPLAAGHSMLLDVADTGKRLIAVGQRGHVIGSLDGENWVQVPTPTRAALTAVTFADTENGWAVGHDAVIIRTRDGGRSWVLQNFEPELEKPFLDVLFLNAQHGFAVGAYALIYETRDGGDSWAEVDTPITEDGWHFNAITKLNNGYLFIAGEAGTLAMSRDNGATWESLESPYESTMFDVVAVGEKGVLIVGLRGHAFAAADADDLNWEQLSLNSENSLIGAASLPNGEAVMVGINGVIFESTNGASSVKRLSNSAGISLASVQPVKDGLLVVGEAGAQLIQNQ